MSKIAVPRWVITQICMPHGVRLGKMREYPVEETDENPRRGWPKHFGFGGVMTPIKQYAPPELKGVFQNWEYRFWAASLEIHTSPVIECRACHKMYGKEDRTGHPSERECYNRLCSAYKLLLKDKRCVICNTRTTKEKWGVPLCTNGCQQAWCEVEAQPLALTQALDLVGSKG